MLKRVWIGTSALARVCHLRRGNQLVFGLHSFINSASVCDRQDFEEFIERTDIKVSREPHHCENVWA